mmetsp:Transcript_33426/g.80930  ORF Transcript_33426/g.80930 Transcript_33426/m.80930 type:complete len:368 (+) Transcript_33426:264-1367(+)
MASSSRCAPKKIKQGTVYEIAEAIDLAYVSNRDFRMMFLRASRYDHQAAALQIIKYLELKRLLFGQEKLTRKITLADLNDDDKDYLESGIAQISTKRDRSGRGILLLFPSLRKRDYEVEAVLRARYYVIMSMLESEEHQMNGVVLVYFGALPTKPNQYASNSGLLWDLPIIYAGIHCCFNELSSFLLISVAILRLPFTLRPRTRVHYGSCTECLYKLSSFGIPKEAILPDSHESSLSDHIEWYRQRQKLELTHAKRSDSDSESLASTGIVPRQVDVLFGPAGRTNEGNLMMRNLVLAMLDDYKDTTKNKKMLLTESIIDEITKKGGRFLKQSEEKKEWEEASHTEACRKIAHTFRNIRRPSRAKKKS